MTANAKRRGRSGGFRPAASQAHARRLPHARLGGGRRGHGAGGLHPLDEGRPQRGARARGVPAPHGHAALPRSAQIGAADSARPMSVPGFPIPSWKRTRTKTSRLPLMLALERLSPLERAAFLLHDVFGLGFEEVAATIERDAAACRQLAHRARSHVRRGAAALQGGKAARPRACRGIFRRLAQRRHEGAGRDAGGRCQPACRRRRQASGSDGADPRLRCGHEGARISGGLFRQNGSKLVRAGFINGLPGFVTLEADGELQTTALDIEDGKIAAIYVVRNPDKLRHLH